MIDSFQAFSFPLLRPYFEWGTLTAFLGLLVYMGLTVRNEKSYYLTHGRPFAFGPLELLLPPWWSLKTHTEQRVEFERKDTRYDWHCSFEWLTVPKNGEKDLLAILYLQLEKWDIVLDPHPIHLQGTQQIPFHSGASALIKGVERLEGTGTMEKSERIYLDVFLLSFHEGVSEKLLLAKSLSSVLNGSIEGPYFEDVVKGLRGPSL